ncbi:MAG: hypothetical protein HY222_05020 [Thaumarchaeota archaeon]|nr:hypothetical protein [Nitrososphaerota archaeon]MBI3641737.1 hypothetical protein [Nitrososphaerota archaeon]
MNYKEITNMIQKNISELQAVVIIDKQGNILECITKDSFESETDLDDLKHISSLISLRFRIVDFDKILHGLEMTVDIFRDYFVLVTSLNDDILFVIVPKIVNLKEIINTILVVNKFHVIVSELVIDNETI